MKVITIGRTEDNDVIIDDACTSRHHLQIIQHDDGHYTLSDFGSTNGTYVNGQKISGEINLAENDIVRIGNTTLPWRLYFESGEHEAAQRNDAVLKNKIEPSTTADPIPTSNSSNITMPLQKERHGFVTFWLWLVIIVNIIGAIRQVIFADYAVWAYATEENAEVFFYFGHDIVEYYIYAS